MERSNRFTRSAASSGWSPTVASNELVISAKRAVTTRFSPSRRVRSCSRSDSGSPCSMEMNCSSRLGREADFAPSGVGQAGEVELKAAPQFGQNFARSEGRAPHAGQLSSSFAPHSVQNFASGGLWFRQLGHRTLPPSDSALPNEMITSVA